MKLFIALLFAFIPLIPAPAHAGGAAAPLINQQDALYVSQTGKTLVYGKACIFMGFYPISQTAVAGAALTPIFYDASATASAVTYTSTTLGFFKGFLPPVPVNLTVTALTVNNWYPQYPFGVNGIYLANGLVIQDAATDTIFAEALYIPLQ
jgi:hypothetical protein